LTTIKPKQITVKLIKEVVAEYFHIDIAALSAKSKVRNVTLPRQVAMYLARELTESSLPKVGEEFGGRNHSTVIHAHDKITSIMDEDADLAERISEIIVRLKSC
jgi:ATPase involved in DNA replication initiation